MTGHPVEMVHLFFFIGGVHTFFLTFSLCQLDHLPVWDFFECGNIITWYKIQCMFPSEMLIRLLSSKRAPPL